MRIHTDEKPYNKLVHTRESPNIYDFIIVSFIKKPSSQKLPLSNLKLTVLFTETLSHKNIATRAVQI